MRILHPNNHNELKKLMQAVKADPYGIEIMLPKAISYLLKIESISNIAANILKQEMLSFGADAAIARGALTGKARSTDCLLIGNLAQFNRLNEKLRQQPFGLGSLAKELSTTLANYQKEDFIIDLGRHKLNTAKHTLIMGIVNLTPDSFSGDGFYQGLSPSKLNRTFPKGTILDSIIDSAEKMIKDGADIIDVGAESSRPGAKPVPLKEELNRVIPAIKALAKKIKAPISVDTYKPEVAKQALDNGANLVNDITGLTNSRMIRLIAKYKAAVVMMHMKGKPRTMQQNPSYKDVVTEIIDFLSSSISRALGAGIKKDKIIIDPGIGFGKSLGHNLEVIKRLGEFKALGFPIMAGTSRKSFIGKILNLPTQERIFGSIASCIYAVKNGCHIVRVHDVKQVKEALKVYDSLNKA